MEKRQHFEYSRAQAAIKSILNNPEHSEKLLAKVGVAGGGMGNGIGGVGMSGEGGEGGGGGMNSDRGVAGYLGKLGVATG